MKKTTTLSALLLVSILIFVSCSSYGPESKRYEVEKAFVSAQKAVKNYGVKPELRSSQDYLNLVSDYLNVYSRFESLFPDLGAKDSLTLTEKEAAFLAGRSLIAAADLLTTGDQVDSAIVLLQMVVNTKYLSPQHHGEALMLLGNAQERQGDWKDAESNYLKLLALYYPPVIQGYFPATDVINLPRDIVQHYAALGDSLAAQQKADWAISYYRKIVSDFPARTPLTLTATRLLAEGYNYKKEYQASVDLLQTVRDSTGNIVDAAKGMIADLYFWQLDRRPEAMNMYEDLVAQTTDSTVLASTLLKLASIEMNNKRYDSGRDYLHRLATAFPNSQQVQLEAQQGLAQSFETEGQFDRAQVEYQNLINGYPNTQQALETTMYMPDFFRKINQPVQAQQWVQRAEEKLRQLADNSSSRRTSLMASTYLATFYLHNQMFDEAIKQLLDLREKFPKSAQAEDALWKVARIYQVNKKDNARALETYQQFVKQYPNSVVRQNIENEITKLQKG